MTSQGKEYSSLLFTPRTTEKSEGYQGRSPARSSRSPSTPAYGRNSVYREGSASRRRSLTPTGSIKDTPPPPPPTFSLLDPSGGTVPSPAPVQVQGNGTLALQPQESTSYGEAAEDTWVTVYGFQPDEEHIILREFAKCGEILQFGSGREDRVNWVHIQYANNYQAQRALLKGGQIVGGRLMVGVKPLEDRHRAAAEYLASSGPPVVPRIATKPPGSRPYKLDSSISQGHMPNQSTSTWAKISEFVLGQ